MPLALIHCPFHILCRYTLEKATFPGYNSINQCNLLSLFCSFHQGYCLYLPTDFITIWFVQPSLALSPTVMWPPQCNIVNFVDQITYPSDINMYLFLGCSGRKEIINLHFCYWFQKKNPGSISAPAKLSKLRVFWWGRRTEAVGVVKGCRWV